MSLQRNLARKLERAIANRDWTSIEEMQKYLTKKKETCLQENGSIYGMFGKTNFINFSLLIRSE